MSVQRKTTVLYGISRKHIDDLEQYGVKRRSGRYPWGSGDDPYQHESFTFLQTVDDYRAKGLTNTQIAKEMNVTRDWLDNEIMLANMRIKKARTNQAKTMFEDGKSISEIAQRLGTSENTVRNYLNPKSSIKQEQFDNLVSTLKNQVENNTYLDVGKGVEYQLDIDRQLGVTRKRLDAAIQQLESEGYYVHNIYIPNVTDSSKYTTVQVLSKEPDQKVVWNNRDQIRSPQTWTDDGGLTWQNMLYPKSVDSSRILVRYKEEGGEDKDGTIELRRNVPDLDMGSSHYAQVRVAVDGTHFLKGMSFYSDNIPDGYDIVVNSNKSKGTPKLDCFKELKNNPDNPFGASISRQIGIKDKNGDLVELTSALNIVNEEGSWDKWSRTISSQCLSKQSVPIIRERLNETFTTKRAEYDDILSIKQDTVRKYLLENYASSLDTQSSHLKAQAYPGQRSQVILPLTSIKPTEVYAPNFENGSKVVLIRYPHGGIFEIPELIVNNKHPEGKSVLGNAVDAIGIHPSVASKLSGADFDGDSVTVIPITDRNKGFKSAPSLPELKNFDTKIYTNKEAKSAGIKTISSQEKQTQMGIVSNLITDMTLRDASQSEIARAVKHSMVVIDSEKHYLDWKASEEENGIAALHKKYQGKANGGASTLISRSNKDVVVDKFGVPLKQKSRTIKKADGTTFQETYFVNEEGKEIKNTHTAKKMTLTDDAFTLSSGTAKEREYALYANKLKALKNDVLKDVESISTPKRDKEAAEKYAKEVKNLEIKLAIANSNSPQERQAQIQANKYFNQKKKAGMSKDDKNKLASQVAKASRKKVGASSKDTKIHITQSEWDAISANALSSSKVRQILSKMDTDEIYKYASPRTTSVMSPAKISRAKSMYSSGKTWQEISTALGIPISTITYNILGSGND